MPVLGSELGVCESNIYATVTHECVVLAVLTRTRATFGVAPVHLVWGLGRGYINEAEGTTGISGTHKHPWYVSWRSHTSDTTQIWTSGQQLFVSQSVMDFLKAAVVASSPFSSVLTPATWARYKHICCNGQDGLLVPVASSLCSASLSVLHCSLALDVRSIHTLLCLTFDLLFG